MNDDEICRRKYKQAALAVGERREFQRGALDHVPSYQPFAKIIQSGESALSTTYIESISSTGLDGKRRNAIISAATVSLMKEHSFSRNFVFSQSTILSLLYKAILFSITWSIVVHVTSSYDLALPDCSSNHRRYCLLPHCVSVCFPE